MENGNYRPHSKSRDRGVLIGMKHYQGKRYGWLAGFPDILNEKGTVSLDRDWFVEIDSRKTGHRVYSRPHASYSYCSVYPAYSTS